MQDNKLLCTRIDDKHEIRTLNRKKATTAPGDCNSKNIIYLITCTICKKGYIGRTTRNLKIRIR